MNLITEQRLLNKQITDFAPVIYSNGVKLIPMPVIINNTKKYVWVVNEFCDETYFDGELISPDVIFDNPQNVTIN
jgi:hypothetical protein